MMDRYWYKDPGCLRIKLEPDEIGMEWFDHDTVILKRIMGQVFRALVPTHTLSEKKDSVPVYLAGRSGGNVILYFPVSNEGRPTWVIPESELGKITVGGRTMV